CCGTVCFCLQLDPAALFCCLFFFSSRRRHTRFSRDWSSDVCSSDLPGEYRELGSCGEHQSLPSGASSAAAMKRGIGLPDAICLSHTSKPTKAASRTVRISWPTGVP